MIELTHAAAQQILMAARQRGCGCDDPDDDSQGGGDRDDRDDDAGSGDGEIALRLAAWPAPDGSVEYGMGFDEEREGDLALCIEGVDLLIGAPSRAFLVGTVLDYVEYEPGDFRFIFIPPAPEAQLAPRSSCGSGGCSGCRSA